MKNLNQIFEEVLREDTERYSTYNEWKSEQNEYPRSISNKLFHLFKSTCEEAAVYTGINVKDLMGHIHQFFVDDIGSDIISDVN